MDIAKYIGLFLLKNNFCYIHGLGNLELRKKPASYDGQSLQAPQYEVLLTTGSIDDNLANFIATDEQISISKAANALRDFSMQSRTALQEGKEVIIPAIGKFIEQNGRIQFISDPNLQYAPPSIPALKTVKRAEEEPKFKTTSDEDHSNGSQVNWGKIALWVIILGVVVTGIILGIRYLNDRNAATQQETTPVTDTPATQAPVMITQPDSMATRPDSAATTTDTAAATQPVQAATPAGNMQYKVVLNTYDNGAKAQKRLKQLTGFGHNVELVSKDSTHYYIVTSVNGSAADTAHVLDSLRKTFNPKGVSIYH